jgi:selenocysteine lyase/cysteine desulfurase
MLGNQRHLFDIPDDVHYLNCAYMSPLLKSAVQAGHAAIDAKARPWGISPPDFFSHSHTARELFAGLIHAEAEQIAIVSSVSYGTAIAALNVSLNSGEKVLVLAEEFPSNLYAWRVKAKACGAQVEAVARPADNDWTNSVLIALEDKRVSVVVIPQTHWIDGGQLDLERIAEARQLHEFSLVIDLTQSLGVVGVDVRMLQPDFLICATYKWLLGPYSLGFIYVHPKHHAGVPLEYGWVNRPGAEDFSRLIDYVDESNADASRFDMGERSNFQLMPIAIAGLKQIHRWGQEQIEARLRDYTQGLRRELEQIGFTACDEAYRSPHYLGMQHPGGLPEDILQRLAGENIFLSKRGDSLRISPHLYNNESDASSLVRVLSEMLAS